MLDTLSDERHAVLRGHKSAALDATKSSLHRNVNSVHTVETKLK